MNKFYVDVNDRDSLYVDKYNKHYASNDDIIKLSVDRIDNTSTRYAISELLAYTLGLKGHALEAFITMNCYCNGKAKSKFNLAKLTIEYYKLRVLPQTIVQAIDTLYDKFILMFDAEYGIKMNPKYYVDENVNNAKFLVLELNPKETSVPLEL